MITLKRIYRLLRVLYFDWRDFINAMINLKDNYNNHLGWLAFLYKATPLFIVRLFINTLIFFYNLFLILTWNKVGFDRNMEVLELTMEIPPYRYNR